MHLAHLHRLCAVCVALVLVVGIVGCHSGAERNIAPTAVAPTAATPSQSGLLGDLNGNGLPNVADAIGILRIFVGIDALDPLADCDGDGNVGVADAIMLLRCVVGLDAWPISGAAGDGTDPGDQTIGPDGQTLVWVPGGSFMMGYQIGYFNERPVHRVTLDGFWIGQCEVTHEQYAAFLNQLRPVYESLHSWVSRDEAGIWWDTQWNAEAGRYDPVYPVTVAPGYEQHPAVLVTSEGAAAYCAHYVYVLPTEAQWEYAARGPDARTWPWGNLWDAGKCCNINNKGPGGTTFPVGSFAAGASWCGALDMTGNIHEWCADWYDEEYYQVSPELNPQGPDSGTHRVARGGFWNTGESACKAARRGPSYVPAGFRVAGTP